MPISVVVGGQFGSEGKGKVALDLVRRDPSVSVVVRPGGTNSGHTGYTQDGRRVVLRQLPAAAIDGNVTVVLPPGSYVDVELLRKEINEVGISNAQVMIDYRAHVIRGEHVRWEAQSDLAKTIGSTGSGTGAAVLSRIARDVPSLPSGLPASQCSELKPFLVDTQDVLVQALEHGRRIVIEGTQGYGLSPLHGESWPRCTSRDTIAASFVSEAGLSPLAVDEIVLVLRSHPIRVAGDSGPLEAETSWDEIRSNAGSDEELTEYTSVTNRVRRVGQFDFLLAKKAIKANAPTRIVLNHLDYVDWQCRNGALTTKCRDFLSLVENGISRRIDWLGVNEYSLIDRNMTGEHARAA